MRGTTIWSIGAADAETSAPGTSPCMVNYQVEDLATLLRVLEEEGCQVLDKAEDSEFGKFGWVIGRYSNNSTQPEPSEWTG